jgi:hypothetical protein
MLGGLRTVHWVLGLFFVVVVLGIGFNNKPKDDGALPLLFPDLEKQINTVDQITVTQFGKTITLKRKDGAWFVSGYDGIPAQFSTVRRTLMALADTKIVEEKTKDPKHYASLDVNDAKTETSKAQNIVLYAGNNPLLSLIMGKEESLLSGTAHPDFYMRLQDTVYWTRGALPFLTQAKAYLDPVLWAIDASRLNAISWQTPTNQGLAKRQTPFDTSWQNAEGAPLGDRDGVLLQSILRQWSDSLTFSDIRPIDSLQSQSPAFTVTLNTFDGFSVTLKGYDDAEKKSVWVMVDAKPTEAKDPTFWESQKPKIFAGSVDLQPKDVVMSDIAELQAKVKGHVFRIPHYPAEFLLPKTEKPADVTPSKTKQ